MRHKLELELELELELGSTDAFGWEPKRRKRNPFAMMIVI
jgi:hypothetical protein